MSQEVSTNLETMNFETLRRVAEQGRIKKLLNRINNVADMVEEATAARVAWREARELQILNLKALMDLVKETFDNRTIDDELLSKVEVEVTRLSNEDTRSALRNGRIDYHSVFDVPLPAEGTKVEEA